MRVTIVIEAAVESLDDALAAVAGGADRLELCAALDVGGTTPDRALLAAVLDAVTVPVYVMIRSRPGDFVFGESELDIMARQAEGAVRAGAAGLVFGALDAAGHVDIGRTQRIVRAAGGRPVTFHRAIDGARDPLASLDVLATLHVARALTAGAAPSALDGVETLAAMVERAGDRITIVAGGGVRGTNVAEIVRRSGVREVHARCGGDASRIRTIRVALEEDDG